MIKLPTLLIPKVKLVYENYLDLDSCPVIKDSEDSYKYFLEHWEDIDLYESSKIILLNTANKALGIADLSQGGIRGTVIDFRIIFTYCHLTMASAFILAHNHPSGSLTPSESDIKITRDLKKGAKYLKIDFLDHIIITKSNYKIIEI